MSGLRSGFAGLAERFARHRAACGTWNDTYASNLRIFDHFCADNYPPGADLSQEMADAWCAKRATETNRSNESRTCAVRMFVSYLRSRGLTDVSAPPALKSAAPAHIPHGFTDQELARFFRECDRIEPYLGRRPEVIRKLSVPVFFRLLYSTGMRTTEARGLRVENVDLASGVIDIQQSKGHDQHYVAMHDTTTALMARYDQAIAEIQPSRTWFFESPTGGRRTRYWVQDNFRALWAKANPASGPAVAYDLRHHYAIRNIDSWTDDGFEFNDKLLYLSKSMGHRSVEATRAYYAITPRLSGTLLDHTEEGFNAIVPEVAQDARE
ncbi:MAG: tyrosine-type recombinase/integrase [Bifidobacteriaceae bacterium]|nr:tyrosine-type recombinase/integrase [Bifidobacteriaceae bacterium]